MATLQDLRDRIIRETNREELLDAPDTDPTAANSATLDQCIQRAIELYADNRFLFNEAILPFVTTGEFYPVPENLRLLDSIVWADGSRYALKKQDYLTIEVWQQSGDPPPDPDTGNETEPFDFAGLYNGLID